MALESTIHIKYSEPISMTCADGTAIPKGTHLKMTDPFTAIISGGDADTCAGIAAEEKIASDGKTKIAVWRDGVFRGFAGGGGVTVGLAITTDNSTGGVDNELVNAGTADESVWGIAMETATDGQSFLFELKPISWNP